VRIRRREFIGVLGASVASLSVKGLRGAAGAEIENGTITKGGWQLKVTPSGEMASFTDGKIELVNRRLGDNRPAVFVGGRRPYPCERPAVSRQDGSKLVFRYDFSGPDNFSVSYELEFVDLPQGMTALRQKIGIEAANKINDSVMLALPQNFQLPFENRKVFLPMKNGIGRRKPILGYESENEYVYSMAGGYEAMGKPQLLAIPMVDEYADQTDVRLTHCTDPYFSSYFFLAHGEKAGIFNCSYPGEVGVEKEERLVYTGLHRGDEKTAMQVFYATSLAEVEPGPDWLHEVAMVDYDYLSKNGQGWFRDIDALEKMIPPLDRAKVFLALHGWYDCVGQYAFDWRRGEFFKEWTAFPSALDPSVQALANATVGAAGYRRAGLIWPKESMKAMRPVPMSLADMHRRIRFAKDKGFRVGIYYADGPNACEGAEGVFDPSKVLRWGGWEGPDTKGKAYIQNPLHPEVREFYRRYIQALLEEYGKEVDGFIWDETFVGAHELGSKTAPGYASRGFITLVKEVAAAVAKFSPQLAFLASDDIGAWLSTDESVPYCLVAHGTYQDSWCTPEGWSYGLIPNYRNVLWSCNWAPVTRFEYSRYAVETFNVPVPISNGAFGDDIGIADMTAEQQKNVMDLFDQRRQKRMDISWIEEEGWNPKYQGRDVGFKWSL
jgi:hypothetical protein